MEVNRPSFGMAANINKEVHEAIKGLSGSGVSRVKGRLNSIDRVSNKNGCDVNLFIKPKDENELKLDFVKKDPNQKPDPVVIHGEITSKKGLGVPPEKFHFTLDNLAHPFGFFIKRDINKKTTSMAKKISDVQEIGKFTTNA